MPQLNDVIDWKQSFFLNLICQLPCTLTVAVCNKSVVDSHSSSSDKDGVADLQGETKGSNNTSTSKSKEKGGMVARKRITNKVYASPYKSRMDVKDAMMNECSFPLVFYTINDYEDENLHLTVTSGEYLCAELSVTVPKVPSREGYTRATELVAQVPLDQDTDPFPLPPSHEKIILFQGAVAFKALSDVYQQKGVAAITQMRGGWGRKDIAVSSASARTEFVLMRGPHGKGQCQGMNSIKQTNHILHYSLTLSYHYYQLLVSIQQPNAPPLLSPPNTVLGFLKDTIKYQLGSPDEEKSLVPAPDELYCSLTYVNVAWQSISSDLMQAVITGSTPPSSTTTATTTTTIP